MKKIMYSEPADYFPKKLRKKWGVGEYYYKEKEEAEKKKKEAEKDNQDFRDYVNEK